MSRLLLSEHTTDTGHRARANWASGNIVLRANAKKFWPAGGDGSGPWCARVYRSRNFLDVAERPGGA